MHRSVEANAFSPTFLEIHPDSRVLREPAYNTIAPDTFARKGPLTRRRAFQLALLMGVAACVPPSEPSTLPPPGVTAGINTLLPPLPATDIPPTSTAVPTYGVESTPIPQGLYPDDIALAEIGNYVDKHQIISGQDILNGNSSIAYLLDAQNRINTFKESLRNAGYNVDRPEASDYITVDVAQWNPDGYFLWDVLARDRQGHLSAWLKVRNPADGVVRFAETPNYDSKVSSGEYQTDAFGLPEMGLGRYADVILYNGYKILIVREADGKPVLWQPLLDQSLREFSMGADERVEAIKARMNEVKLGDKPRFTWNSQDMPAQTRELFNEVPKTHETTWGEFTVAAFDHRLNRIVFVTENNEIVGMYNKGENKINQLPEGIVYMFGHDNVFVFSNDPQKTVFYRKINEHGETDQNGSKLFAGYLRGIMYILWTAENGREIEQSLKDQVGDAKAKYFTSGPGETYFDPNSTPPLIWETRQGQINFSQPIFIMPDESIFTPYEPVLSIASYGTTILTFKPTPDKSRDSIVSLINGNIFKLLSTQTKYPKYLNAFSFGISAIKRGVEGNQNARFWVRP